MPARDHPAPPFAPRQRQGDDNGASLWFERASAHEARDRRQPVDLKFAYTLSAQAKLVTAHEVYLPKPKLAVEGPGGVQASFDFRGAKNDAAGRMLTVTLTNDLDGTAYA
jgi:hypothetical protein